MTRGSRAGIGLFAMFAWLALSAFDANAADTAPEDAGTRAAQLADIKVVRTRYLPKEMAYSPATRALAEVQLDKLERQAGSLSPAQFLVGLAQAGALTDNAHSGMRVNDPQTGFKARLPVRLLWFPDQLIVARAYGMAADLAGARVLRIEGRSPEALYQASKVLLGGNDAGRKHWLNEWIESAGVLHALGVAKSPDRLSLTLQLLNGTTVERTLPMLPIAEVPPTAESARLWSPEHVKGEHGWSSALGPVEVPLYLRDADRPFRSVELPELHTLYVQFRWNQDDEGFPIAKFVESVQKQITDTHATHLVMDLRFDVGGNILTTLDFMRHFAASVSGRTFLLVGPYTFSAGIVSAAAVKKHGGERVTVIGDGLGDRLAFWSEGNSFELPHSRYTFRYTDGQFNLLHGCTGEPRCMDDLYPVDVNGASLVPDIHAPLTSVDYFARRDPAMEAVAAALSRGATPSP